MTPESVTLRPARQRDLRGIVLLWKALQEENAAADLRLAAGPDAEFWLTEYLHDSLDDDRTGLFVAELDGQVVGFISGQIHRRPTLAQGSVGYIADLAVAEGRRGQGIGTGLVGRLRAWFAAHEVRSLEVQVVAANGRARAFWEKCGFGSFLWTLRADP